jgi:hypothetical protein
LQIAQIKREFLSFGCLPVSSNRLRSRITGFWLEGGDLAVKIKAMLVMYGLKLLNDCLF